MTAAYREAEILVVTSDWEGTPNVVLEASASGLPVVATRVGGVPEVVKEGETGFLCDREDTDGLVSAVSKLVADDDLRRRMGEQGRRFVQENHSLERLGKSLAELYTADSAVT